MEPRPPDNKDIRKIIDRSTDDLHQRIDRQRHMMIRLLAKELDDEAIEGLSSPSTYPRDERKLREAIREAIEVLEESRKSFKSKRLEVLRKKLTRLLIAAE